MPPEAAQFDAIVIGAGAAGLMCAIEAAKRGRQVLVLERSEAVGKKILISGGGRCNFTNINASPDNYLSNNPHFCKSALSRYTPHHFIELVQQHRIAYHEKTLGQLFCNDSSRQIVQMLKHLCEINGVTIRLNSKISKIEKTSRFEIETQDKQYSSETVVVACGGLSIPKMGATDFGHRIARQFALSVTECRPALVPLTLNSQQLQQYSELSGVALHVSASCEKKSFVENMLFTHRGVSGPVILQISSYWKQGKTINLDLFPDTNIYVELVDLKQAKERSELKTILSGKLSKRFAEVLNNQLDLSKSVYQYNEPELKKISEFLHKFSLAPSGDEGYAKAEVTLGGVDTNELSSKTMESKKVEGLFFIGEVVDVTGHLGGYNFQWAWASGHAAGGEC